MLKRLALLALPFLAASVQANTTSISDVNVGFDSRCFDPYTIQVMPDQSRLDNETFALTLNQFATAGLNVTSPECGAIAPTITLDATTDSNGCDIGGSTDAPTLTCTLSSTTLDGHTSTVTFDNALGTAVTRQFDWTVTESGAEPTAATGIAVPEQGNTCDLYIAPQTGTDSGSCDSHANRCATVEYAKGFDAPGDSFCVLKDETITYASASGFLGLDQDNPSNDWGGIKCYETTPSEKECDPGEFFNIDGQFDEGVEATAFAQGGHRLIRIRGDNTFIRNARCTDAPGVCFGTNSSSSGGSEKSGINGVAYQQIECDHVSYGCVYDIHKSFIQLYEDASSNETGLCKYFRNPIGGGGCTAGNFIGAPFGVTNGSGFTLARRIEVNNHPGGEGFAALTSKGPVVVEDSVFGTMGSVQIYGDGTEFLYATRNILFNEDDNPQYGGYRGGGDGMWATSESYGCSRANHDRHAIFWLNFNANAGSMKLGTDPKWLDDCGGWRTSLYAAHNTNVLVNFNIATSNGGGHYKDFQLINNSFGEGCSINGGELSGVDTDIDYNNWPVAESGACEGPNDVIGAEDLVGTVWDQYSPTNYPVRADFAPNPGSPVQAAARPWLALVTSASNTGTTFVVDMAGIFQDGARTECEANPGVCVNNLLTDPHVLQVGDDTNLTVMEVDYDTDTITVDRSFTWVTGDWVCIKNCSGNDIGWDTDLE